MSDATHWKTALRTYVRISFGYFLQFTLPVLAVILMQTAFARIAHGHWFISLIALKLMFIFGGIFFILALITAVGDDVQRNWGSDAPTVEWNPAVMWKTFLHLGSVFFLGCAFFSYHQACG